MFQASGKIISIIISFLSVSTLLVLFDIFNGNTGWGLKFGIPLLVIAYLIIIALVLIIKNAREKQMNLITYSLIAAGLLSICIEGLISLYQERFYQASLELDCNDMCNTCCSHYVLYTISFKERNRFETVFHI